MYDSKIPQSAIPVARETLAQSDAMRGLSAMTQPNVGMTNMDTGRAYSNPSATAFGQMEEQAALGNQEMMQNIQSAGYQAAAGARGAAIAMNTEVNDKAARAQSMMNERIADILDAQGNGGALMQLNALVQSPERESLMNNLATSRAMYNQQAPELGAYQASTKQYGMLG